MQSKCKVNSKALTRVYFCFAQGRRILVKQSAIYVDETNYVSTCTFFYECFVVFN